MGRPPSVVTAAYPLEAGGPRSGTSPVDQPPPPTPTNLSFQPETGSQTYALMVSFQPGWVGYRPLVGWQFWEFNTGYIGIDGENFRVVQLDRLECLISAFRLNVVDDEPDIWGNPIWLDWAEIVPDYNSGWMFISKLYRPETSSCADIEYPRTLWIDGCCEKAVIDQPSKDVMNHIETILFFIIIRKAVLSSSVAVIAPTIFPVVFENTAGDGRAVCYGVSVVGGIFRV
ncbi:hypothetical protein HG531_012158 [Fusarium graminearum]|nr:hypothetical protein HG531_012158 [Fusarium graminearum]